MAFPPSTDRFRATPRAYPSVGCTQTRRETTQADGHPVPRGRLPRDVSEGHASDAPKVRELPAPRRNQSVIGPLFRWVFTWPYRVALAGLFRAGVRPWQLTTLSFLTNVIVGWLLITGRRFLPGMLLLPAGLFDIFDGGVARLRGEESRWGAFLDSVVDRLSDAIVLGAL